MNIANFDQNQIRINMEMCIDQVAIEHLLFLLLSLSLSHFYAYAFSSKTQTNSSTILVSSSTYNTDILLMLPILITVYRINVIFIYRVMICFLRAKISSSNNNYSIAGYRFQKKIIPNTLYTVLTFFHLSKNKQNKQKENIVCLSMFSMHAYW